MEQRIGPYRVVRQLGAGGMGSVLEVEDEHGRRLALKTIPTSGRAAAQLDHARRRFAREAELGARVQHPGVQAVVAAQLTGPQPYLVVELLGQSLEERLRGGPLPLERTLELGLALTRALRAAHAAGIVHRDLKPANVLFRGEEPVLIDFGVAVSLSPDTLRLTVPGMLVGTYAAMSPEQGRGKGDTPASDAYALGGILYRCLSGQPPLDLVGVSSLTELLARLHGAEPRPLRELRADVPPPVARLVHRLLAKDPGARPDLAQVELTLSQQLQAPTPGGGHARRAVAILAALGGALALGAGVSLLGEAGPPATQPGPSATPPGATAPSAVQLASPLAELRRAIARADYEAALRAPAELLSDPEQGREARFLSAWAAYGLGRDARADPWLDSLRDAEDRWGLLARALVWPEAAAFAALARAYPDCVYAVTCRGEGNKGSAHLADVLRLQQDEPGASFVPLWLLRARLEAREKRFADARASMAEAQRLAGHTRPPGMARARARLAYAQGDLEAVAQAYGEAAERQPGAYHVLCGGTLERMGRFSAALDSYRAGVARGRLSYLSFLENATLSTPVRLRLRRYAGLAVLLDRETTKGRAFVDGELARAQRKRLTAPIPEPQRERVEALLARAQAGEGYALLAKEVEALRGELESSRAWWELEARLQTSRRRFPAARIALGRAARLGFPPQRMVERLLLLSLLEGRPATPAQMNGFAARYQVDLASTATGRTLLGLSVGDDPKVLAHARDALQQNPDDLTAAMVAILSGRPEASELLVPTRLLQRWTYLYADGFHPLEAFAIETMLVSPEPPLVSHMRGKLVATEALLTAYPHPTLLTQAIRLALRLPPDDPWRASIPMWLHEVQLLLGQSGLGRRAKARAARVQGSWALTQGASEAEVRALWGEAAAVQVLPDRWERNRYRERFGREYAPR